MSSDPKVYTVIAKRVTEQWIQIPIAAMNEAQALAEAERALKAGAPYSGDHIRVSFLFTGAHEEVRL